MENRSILLSTAYFAPVQYYCKLVDTPEVIIEQFENFNKQTYRNRCLIQGANGIQPLIVPLVAASRKKTVIRDVKIDYDTMWQKLHFKSIEAAYRSSPFYEYYIDDIAPFFNKKWNFLWDFNEQIRQIMCQILEIEPNITLSKDYIEKTTDDQLDFRNAIHPKPSKSIIDTTFKAIPYTQVFGDRHGFSPNMSILDVIFNIGPEGSDYLQKCITGK